MNKPASTIARGSAISINVDDFEPKTVIPPRQALSVIEEISEASGFPSRQAHKRTVQTSDIPVTTVTIQPVTDLPTVRAGRRVTKGRTEVVNMKLSRDVKARFYAIAEEQGVSLADVFDIAIDALDRELAGGGHKIKFGVL